ncbi:MAG: helix-turn-helix domain-containing protein [Pseudonocardiaceae bacterium]
MAREPVHVVELRCALGGVLGVCRQRVGWSQAKLADKVHYHRSAISHLEAGRHPAPRDFWERADALLGAEGALVAGYDDLAVAKRECQRSALPHHGDGGEGLTGEPDDDPVLSAPWTSAGTVEAAVVLRGGDGRVKRRVFISLTGAALTAPAHQWLIHEPGPLVSGLSGRRVSIELVDRFTAMIAELRRTDDVAGGGGVLALAEQQFGWVARLLDQASYDETTGRALHVVLAELGQLCGWAAYDAGHQGLAQRYYIAGLRATHTADDRPLGAHILSCMTEQAARQGQPAEAVTLVDTAVVGLRGQQVPSLLAMLYNCQAYAFATLGDASGCAAAMAKARAHIDRLTPGANPAWLYWVNSANMTAEVGNSLRKLGHAEQAARTLETGIAMFDGALPRGRLGYLTALADIRARPGRQRDLDAAAGLGMEAIQLVEGLDSTRSVGLIRDLHNQMVPHHKVPAVRDFLARARGLAQV